MGTIYELWDADEAYPIIEYRDLAEALAFVAGTMDDEGEEAIAGWVLIHSTPTRAWTKVVAQGKDLARLAREHTHVMPA